ncbi:hypothetical protein [Streptomyces sp. bgisy153]|uniref:hypothetical protein n=1 Tax=Streptomyces sp. bgisy153 TaxID=3413793 RepID=UPI003D75D071
MSEASEGALEELAQRFTRITLKPLAKTGEIELKGGPCLSFPVQAPQEDDSSLEAISYYFGTRTVQVVTKGGHSFEVDMDEGGDVSPVDGRKVVYLDQCHWSTLAKRLNGGNMASSEVSAADKFIDLARSRNLILPMSAGHFVETTATFGEKRVGLASTILSLSRGWRMRHPIQVRKDEVRSLLSARAQEIEWMPPPVFTLDPAGMFDERLPQEGAHAFPVEISRLLNQLTCIAADYDTLMEPDQIESERIGVWESTYTKVMNDQEFRSLSKVRRRSASHGLVILDISTEVARIFSELHVAEGDVSEFTRHLHANVPSMPFWGLYADALDFRLSQGNTKWQSNDLIDMLYLSCAAGYADLVVAERAATNYLNAAWGDRRGKCPVVRNLAQAVERL